MSQVSDQIRLQFGESDDRRDAGLVMPDGLAITKDIPYGQDDKWQSLDLYRPKKTAKEILPVIVVVHGGGWVYGDKERYQFYAADLASRGYAVICYTYRLAPEFQFPAPLEDTNLVFSWLMENAGAYQLDKTKVFAVGDSAGAHILGLYANIITNPQAASKYSFTTPESLTLSAVGLHCGAYKIDLEDQGLTKLLMEDFLPNGGNAEELEQINVLKGISSNFPPAFISTAVEDFLQKDAPLLVECLTEAEVPFSYNEYGNKNNRLKHVFHLNLKLKDAKICNDDNIAFFHRFLDD